jgi:hypothetical protein
MAKIRYLIYCWFMARAVGSANRGDFIRNQTQNEGISLLVEEGVSTWLDCSR